MEDTGRITRLYQAITEASSEREPPFRDRPIEERRAYLRERARAYRAKGKASAESGRLEARGGTIRDALADAALILLASGAPGSDAIERLLGIAFSGRPGVPGTVRAKARAGAIKPKILTPEVLRDATSPSPDIPPADRHRRRVACKPPCVSE
ncbi:MAG TPA: hypothetical protein VGO06_16005 [Bosea sp. (in: a-proteobacteria)]|uniref:hypothetical protein n=1 Tax=Bosea sp. (in: a-proteobacteria) TaxID=1871050 RepID=UPI002E0F6EEC|nr:hypothetical protein [Bosea sp. (in: a-proteobacteria)]